MNAIEAEKLISVILATLELDSGCLVKSISIEDRDVTTIVDDRRQISRTAVIDLERSPGSRWA